MAGQTSSNDGDISRNHGLSDAWLEKFDSYGNIKWEKTLGGSKSDNATAVLTRSDGSYVLTGTTGSNDGDISGYHGGVGTDAWVVTVKDK